MNTAYTPIIAFLGTGTFIVNILFVVGLLIYLVSFRTNKKSPFTKIASFLGNNSIAIALVIATVATLSSLFLSEIVHFIPCKLCWYGRIVMYPQVIILGIALLRNDTKVKLTSLVLSSIGLLIATYHIMLQFFPNIFPCSDEVANCALVQFTYYGYITIPVMEASAFVLIILLMLFGLRAKDK